MSKRKPKDLIKEKKNRNWTSNELELFARGLADPDEGFIDTLKKKAYAELQQQPLRALSYATKEIHLRC